MFAVNMLLELHWRCRHLGVVVVMPEALTQQVTRSRVLACWRHQCVVTSFVRDLMFLREANIMLFDPLQDH